MTNYRQLLSLDNLLAAFPWQQYPDMTANQREALEIIARAGSSVTLEMPTGSGKTAVGYTVLNALSQAGAGPLFYIVPNRTLVDQVRKMHPDLTEVYGRHEYDCLYYTPEIFRADEIPCLSLDCPHRVDQATGEVQGKGVVPCPYYTAKYNAKQSSIVVCTAAFYLFTQLYSKEFERPAGLVIDEAHQIARIFRSSLSYEITDWHLSRAIEMLEKIGARKEASGLLDFLTTMMQVLRRKPSSEPVLLKDEEIMELMASLSKVDGSKLRERIAKAIQQGKIDPARDRVLLKQLEAITYDLYRYVRSFEYALPGERRHALSYITYAYSEKEPTGSQRVQYRLIIRAYHVAPLVRKLLSPMTLAYSATIGDADVFGFETGIKAPVHRLSSPFSAENTKVLLPSDTANLAVKARIRQEPTKTLRTIVRMCKHLDEQGLRSLMVVVSNAERDKFLWLCQDEGVEAVSYGDGVTPREAVAKFKAGEGVVLVGTTANFGEGIDLPEEVAPVIFFLRPSYPNPRDPATQFEERRFGNGRWRVWNWRVMIEALQVRGRNIRSVDDRGVTIFISQQFRSFLFSSLPEWLQESYDGQSTLEQSLEATLELLAGEPA